MANRKPISKSMRQRVFDKFNGHCAYCGCELTIYKMQIDFYLYGKKTDNSFENLMPSCNLCFPYKGNMDIEWVRSQLENLINSCRLHYPYLLAERYGMVEEKQWDGKFYFERIKQWQDDRKDN